LLVLEATGANTLVERIEIGAQVYLSGNFSGIEKSAWQTI
jgi:isocitrate dehydrogenase